MTTTPVRTRHRLWAMVRLARPWFWPLGWGGAYLGSMLATGALVPPPAAWPRSAGALIELGWTLHRPATDYPPVLALLVLLLAAALYLPTTVLDRAADERAEYQTSAVRWRPESCYRAGVASWAAARALWLAVCHLGVLVVRDSWWLQTLTAPLLVWLYAAMARRPTIARMAVVVAAFAVPAGDFLSARIS